MEGKDKITNSTMSNNIFDLKQVKQLVELMKANDLTDVEIKQGEQEITLRRGSQTVMVASAPAPVAVQSAPVSAPPATVPAAPAPAAPATPANVTVIKSPMVGTFYAAAKPDSPPFAKVGDTVSAEKTVCIIEAMKVMNEIQAECSGKVVAVLVKNGETVEFGKPLFHVAAG